MQLLLQGQLITEIQLHDVLWWLQEHFVPVGSIQWQCRVCSATVQQTVSVWWSWSWGVTQLQYPL